MASTAMPLSQLPQAIAPREVSLARLYLLRATYALLVIGLGATILPQLVSHAALARGVIPSLLGAVWLLAWLGLRYPLQMLPLLMFELAWKTIWLVDFGLAQYSSGQRPPTFSDDFPAILAGVIVMPLVIPWPYIWRRYVRQQGDGWR